VRKTCIVVLTILCFKITPLAEVDHGFTFNPQISVRDEAAKYLKGITILNVDGTVPDPETTIQFPSPGIIRLNLALADSASNSKSITLQPRLPEQEFKVVQQYETSLSLMNEGPHIDLKNWKHHISKWEEIKSSNGITFLTKEVESDNFPRVSQGEIVQALKAELDRLAKQGYNNLQRWVPLAMQCKDATTYPCGVSISKITIRIKVRQSGKWKDIQTVELIPPMGC